MRSFTFTAAAIALTLGTVQTAEAQSFLEGLARRAADRVASEARRRAEGAAEDLMSRRSTDDAEEAGETQEPNPPEATNARSTQRTAPRVAARAAEGPAPWPLNAGAATYTGELQFDPIYAQQYKAVETFGKSRCNDCEGGYAYDTFISHYIDAAAQGGVPARVGRMAIGESLTWRGEVTTGRLEVLSDTPVGAFPCKQVRLTLTKGQENQEALGLYCKGKSHAYAADMWVRVL